MNREPGSLSRIVLAVIWSVVGLGMVASTVWLGWTSWEPVLSGHPAMLALTIAAGLVGVVAVAWAIASLATGARQDAWTGRPGQQRLRTPAQRERLARLRIAAAVPALLVCVVLVGALVWARPLPASSEAIDATRSRETVRAGETLTWYTLTPTKQDDGGRPLKPTTGLIVVPEARVDPRAYAKVLAPLAEAGYLVVVLREPFNLAAIDPRHAQRVMRIHTTITTWVVAGHGLGGRVATEFADAHPQVAGLVLWGATPRAPLERADLRAVSVYGTADGVTTPAAVEATRAYLPDAAFVPIDGAVHGYFGDYGTHPGDGLASIDRSTAQGLIQQATQDLLVAVTPPPPKKKK